MEAGNARGEWYSPTQPFPTKPPPFTQQGFTKDDVVDWTPEIKARALEIVSHYKLGPIYTPPSIVTDASWGTLAVRNRRAGTNWPGGSVDLTNGLFYIYSKANTQVFGVQVSSDGKLAAAFGGLGRGNNDNIGGAFWRRCQSRRARRQRRAGPSRHQGRPERSDHEGPAHHRRHVSPEAAMGADHGAGSSRPARRCGKSRTGNARFREQQSAAQGYQGPRTGQAGILGVLTTKSLVICGDSGVFTGRKGRKAARLRAYDKVTGTEVGAAVMGQPQTGSPMTYMFDGNQYIVVASGGFAGSELIAYRLPSPKGSAPPVAPQPGPGPTPD